MTDRPQPIFYFDIASPNAYFAHKLIPQIEARTGATFDYVPVLLGGLFKLTGNQAPMVTFAGVPNKLAYERQDMERFIARHDLTAFRMNPHFPVNTLQVMRAAIAAKRQGVLAAYTEAMFRALWEQTLILADMGVFQASLTDAGLDSNALIADAQKQESKDMLLANTQSAFERGAFGIPSFLVGKELFFGKDRLLDVELALLDGD